MTQDHESSSEQKKPAQSPAEQARRTTELEVFTGMQSDFARFKYVDAPREEKDSHIGNTVGHTLMNVPATTDPTFRIGVLSLGFGALSTRRAKESMGTELYGALQQAGADSDNLRGISERMAMDAHMREIGQEDQADYAMVQHRDHFMTGIVSGTLQPGETATAMASIFMASTAAPQAFSAEVCGRFAEIVEQARPTISG